MYCIFKNYLYWCVDLWIIDFKHCVLFYYMNVDYGLVLCFLLINLLKVSISFYYYKRCFDEHPCKHHLVCIYISSSRIILWEKMLGYVSSIPSASLSIATSFPEWAVYVLTWRTCKHLLPFMPHPWILVNIVYDQSFKSLLI